MNYKKIYDSLCCRGQCRTKEVGVCYEKHHIKPRAFGGTDRKSNLTLLTLKEHYFAHLLLTVIYPNNKAMYNAIWMMCNATPKDKVSYDRYKLSSRTYQRLKTEYITLQTGITLSETTREAMRKSSNKGKTLSKERVDKIVAGCKNRIFSDEVRKLFKDNATKHSQEFIDIVRKDYGVLQRKDILTKYSLTGGQYDSIVKRYFKTKQNE